MFELYFAHFKDWILFRFLSKRNLYKLFLLILIIFYICPVGYAFDKDISIISSTESEFHFKITINPDELDRLINNDSQVTLYRAFQIGVPYGSKPELVFARGNIVSKITSPFLNKIKLSNQSYPLGKISQPFTVRGRQVVTIQIFPVTANNFYSEVEVKVVFNRGVRGSIPPTKDPHFDKIFSTILVNYEQYKNWKLPYSAVRKVEAVKTGPFSDISSWYKISVNQTGLYKITGAQLEAVGVSLNNLQSLDIHLYNGGGLPLEVPNENPRPEFKEISIIVEDGGDAVFHRDDYLLFYGESQNRWIYPVGEIVRFVNNNYTDHNVYWLSVSNSSPGLRMAEVDASYTVPEDTVITYYRKRVHVEQDNMLRRFNSSKITDYYTWYWTDENNLTFYVSTPDNINNDTADIKLVGITLDTPDSLNEIGYMDLNINGIKGLNKICTQFECSYQSVSLIDGSNKVDLTLWPYSTAPPYFDYMDLSYHADNLPVNNKLDLTLGSYSGRAEIEVIDNFTTTPLILDISQPLNPTIMTGAVTIGGLITFYADMDVSRFNRYYLCPKQNTLSPLSIEAATTVDLYTASEQIDLIVVTSQNFVSALTEYVEYRRAGGYTVKVTTVKDITDNFSFGLYDPTAIRDFLKYTYENYPSPVPSAVLFIGDASFDFLDRLSYGVSNFVPPYIFPNDISSSDDNYVYFGKYGILDSDTSYNNINRGFDMITARWPVKSTGEIAVITDKIKRYESSSHFGIWRNNITLVADDEFGTFDNETIHTTQTENLEKNYVPAFFNRDKIYLWEYPFVGREKPEVNDVIVNAINDGTLLINYVGHGNPGVWAHEHVLTRLTDLPRLNNVDQLPLVFAASCAIGFFDNPVNEGMAEDFLVMANGGAVGVISATRLVYSSPNAAFNKKVFEILLYNDSLSMCEAMYAAKLQRQYIINNNNDTTIIAQENDRTYIYFGEPFVRLGIPELAVEFTSAPDSLIALSTTQVSGRVLDKQGAVYNTNGILVINVYDSEREKTYRLVNSNGVVTEKIDYSVTGPTIYRGTASINAGEFNFEFVPPLDLGFGGQGAKISVYAMFDNIDGTGIIDSIDVSESIASFTDSTGPDINVTFAGRNNFISGDIIGKDEQMKVTLSDPSGINLAGGLGHGITLEIDNKSENLINLTGLFKYAQDDFTKGSLDYLLENLEPGNHNFKIKTWDNANNSAIYEFDAEILLSEQLAIVELMNYPNPMRDSTQFSFNLTQMVEKFSLEIFTLSGRKIQSFNRYSLSPAFYDDIVWYGQDFAGDRVATEVYIYKATAYPINGEAIVESFGKIVVIN